MLPPGLSSPAQVVLYHNRVYDELISAGKAYPFIYPWISIGVFGALLYLLVDHRRSSFLAFLRYPIFILLCVFQAWILLYTRARDPAAQFGVGLYAALGIFWVGAYMIADDCQVQYRRIERRSYKDSTKPMLYWQEYPADSLIERVDWIVDMFFSFRGVGWNWQTSGVPEAPKWVQSSLQGKTDVKEEVEATTVSRTGLRRIDDRKDLVWRSTVNFVLGYIALDVIKTYYGRDPYFWGYTDAPAPAFLPDFLQSSHFLTKWWRLIMSLLGVFTALRTAFQIGPIFFAGMLGPKWYGLRGEAWMNPIDMYGSFNMVLDKGLAGFWGGWWHQTFRYGFEAPSNRILSTLGISKRSQTGKLLGLLIAFLLSGCLHASGSYTELGPNRPLRGPMTFFLLQALGCMIESFVSDALKASGIKLPKLLQRARSLSFVLFWFYYTAPLFVDDFAQGGVWLFEPIPVSLFRGLGLGPADAGWWCWWNRTTTWHRGSSWWDTGIAL